jgi:hypothetical protein
VGGCEVVGNAPLDPQEVGYRLHSIEQVGRAVEPLRIVGQISLLSRPLRRVARLARELLAGREGSAFPAMTALGAPILKRSGRAADWKSRYQWC